jgi:hypothetical protein
MLYAITKGMDQNVVALHTPNGMLDKDTNATQGRIGSFLLGVSHLLHMEFFTGLYGS